jgi:glycosyltransferase involved in cell wall biosynthesis
MKLFFVIKSLHLAAGTERSTITVANGLSDRNHHVELICLVNEGKPFFEISQKVKVRYLYDKDDKRMSLVRDLARRKQLRKIYVEENPDIIIIVGSGRSFLNIPAARGFKNITWEHFNVNVNWHLLHPLSKKMAASFSDRIVTLTNKDAENYRKKLGARSVCIPNAITIENQNKSPLTEKRVLAIGRLSNQKGFDLLVQAWSQTEHRNRGWKLRIVGSGKMLPLLLKMIKELDLENSVEIIPTSTDVISHYRQASIFVMSSRYEGLPLVLIEAMAMGLPIVSFDCETGPQDIVVDQETGVLVPPLDVSMLTKELETLMANEFKRKLFAEKGIQNSKKFEPKVILDKWESLLKELKNEK